MQVARNEPLVASRKRLRGRVALFTLVLLVVIMALPFIFREIIILVWALFFLAFVVTSISKQLNWDWGPGILPDQSIAAALKTLGNRYWFGAYLPIGKRLVSQVLVGPEGVLVFESRAQPGEISCRQGRWRRKTGLVGRFFGPVPPLGDPTRDLEQSVEALRTDLAAAGLGDVPVSGAIVLTAQNAAVDLDGCPVTALTLAQLEAWANARRNMPPPEGISDPLRLRVIEHLSEKLPPSELPSAAPPRQRGGTKSPAGR